MKNWQLLFGVILGFIFSGIVLLVAQGPRGQPLELKPLPTEYQLTIYISGAVTHPGVYTLPNPSRLLDAILLAGGFNGSERLDSINLAAPISDGQKIEIPSSKSTISEISPSGSPDQGSRIRDIPSPTITYPININIAPASTLEILPGIGPSKAQQIVLYRQEHGPFTSIEGLLSVPGIGLATLDKLKDLICISELK